MTQRHSQRTHYGPSVLSLAAGTVLTSLSITGMLWVLSDHTITSHHLAGAGGCIGLAVLLGAQTLARAMERQDVQNRRHRQEEAARRLRAGHTGSWISPDGGLLTVRREPSAPFGWYVLDPVSRTEIEWRDLDQLKAMIGELEGNGWARLDDDATRDVCDRLDLGPEVDPPGERTVKLDYYRQPFTEVQRAAWMDAPTEVVRRAE